MLGHAPEGECEMARPTSTDPIDRFRAPRTRSRRGRAILWALSAAPLALLGPSGPALAQGLSGQVNRAIERGVENLREILPPEGWGDDPWADGLASLHLLTFLKSGVPPGDPDVKRCLEWARQRAHHRTYSTGVRLMALDALGRKSRTDLGAEIREGAQWLVETWLDGSGLWSYGHDLEHGNEGDLSNTQYAVLGLWTARRHGFEVSPDLWERLAQAVESFQTADGGFTYVGAGESTGSMTTAGIFVLSVCAEELEKAGGGKARARRRVAGIRDSIERGWEHLTRRFDPSGNPIGPVALTPLHHLYYLYGLERACALEDRRALGERDWYREGATWLVRNQLDHGGWEEGAPDTCFALLFLRRATFSTVGADEPDPAVAAPETRAAPVPPAPGVPFLGSWLVLGPFEDRDDTALEKPLFDEPKADPAKGRTAKRRRWTPYRSPGNFVDLARAVGAEEHALAYACCRLRVEEPVEAALWFGSDDGARIWLDGKLVHDQHNRFDGLADAEGADAHLIPVHLSAGTHLLLVKVSNFVGGWGFFLRLARPDGSPVEGMVSFADRGGPVELERLDAAAAAPDLGAILKALDLDRHPRCAFDSTEDLDRILIADDASLEPGLWHEEVIELEGPRPPLGVTGFLDLRPIGPERPLRIYRKLRNPGKRFRVLARVAASHPVYRTAGDWHARLGIYDGTETWFEPRRIGAPGAADETSWIEVEAEVEGCKGREILLVLECAIDPRAHPEDWPDKRVFVDELSVR